MTIDRWDYMLVYTTEAGGIMQPSWGGPERFEELRRKGTIQLHPELDPPPPEVPLHFLALCRVEQNYDFGLGKERL